MFGTLIHYPFFQQPFIKQSMATTTTTQESQKMKEKKLKRNPIHRIQALMVT